MDDVLLNKIDSLERCLNRINEEFAKDWKENFTFQDALLLNMERACQLSIDMAAHLVRKEKLGLPKFSSALFDLLGENDIISLEVAESMKRMVGFRNISVHEYGKLNLAIVENIVLNELDVFKSFVKFMLNQSQKGE